MLNYEEIALTLVEECGAQVYIAIDAVCDLLKYRLTPSRSVFEYRFQGDLGFGGKLVSNMIGAPNVTCYKEDETPERLAALKKANERLQLSWENPNV